MATHSHPGHSVERRWMFRLPLLLAAGSLAARAERFDPAGEPGAEPRSGPGGLDFQTFVKVCGELSVQANRDTSLIEDAHAARIAEAALRLNRSTVPAGKLYPFGGFVDIGPIAKAPALAIILWRMAPGAVFPPHDHDPVDVVTLCLEGSCRVRHFEIEGPRPPHGSREAFTLRETLDQHMTPGRCSSLTRGRDYIHTFQAGPNGVLAMDINTSLPGEGGFSFIDLKGEAVDLHQRLFKGCWKTLPPPT